MPTGLPHQNISGGATAVAGLEQIWKYKYIFKLLQLTGSPDAATEDSLCSFF